MDTVVTSARFTGLQSQSVGGVRLLVMVGASCWTLVKEDEGGGQQEGERVGSPSGRRARLDAHVATLLFLHVVVRQCRRHLLHEQGRVLLTPQVAGSVNARQEHLTEAVRRDRSYCGRRRAPIWMLLGREKLKVSFFFRYRRNPLTKALGERSCQCCFKTRGTVTEVVEERGMGGSPCRSCGGESSITEVREEVLKKLCWERKATSVTVPQEEVLLMDAGGERSPAFVATSSKKSVSYYLKQVCQASLGSEREIIVSH